MQIGFQVKDQKKFFIFLSELAEVMSLVENSLLHGEARGLRGLIDFYILYFFLYTLKYAF